MKHFTFLKSFLLLCALVVGSNVAWADDYKLIKSISELSEGDVILITSGSDGDVYAMGTYSSGNNVPAKSVSISSETISSLGNAQEITLESKNANGNFTLKQAASAYFYAANSSSGSKNYLKTKDDNAIYWSITINTTSYVAAITDVTSSCNNRNKLKYNYNSGTPIFSCYNSADNNLYIFKKTSSDPSSAASFGDKTPSINFPAHTTYSQIPGTAAGYEGTITYEITANTAGATINASSGLVTVTQEGSVTVKATAAAVPGSFAESSDSYTLTVTDTRMDNGLDYAETDQEVTVGEVLDAPTLTNPNGLSVTYSSEDEDIATVDASGNVTGVAVGSTTITASFAGNETYKAGSASYTITVTAAPFVVTDGVFDFTQGEDYGSGLSTSGVKEQTSTWTAGNVEMYMAGRNCWYNNSGTTQIRLYKASGDAAAGSIQLSVPSGFIITEITISGANLQRLSADNDTYDVADGNASATWTGYYNNVTFTASDRTDINTITVSYAKELTVSYADGWMSYVTPSAITFPENVEAYVVTALSPSLTREKITSAPSGTPVVLHATEGAKTYALPVAASADAPASNELNVSDGTVTGDGKIYVLTVKGGQAGFAPLKTGSTLSAGKVYIEFPTAPAKDFIGFGDDETTSINLNVNDNLNCNSPMYNLAGQRVGESYKGIVIVNGRKYINK